MHVIHMHVHFKLILHLYMDDGVQERVLMCVFLPGGRGGGERAGGPGLGKGVLVGEDAVCFQPIPIQPLGGGGGGGGLLSTLGQFSQWRGEAAHAPSNTEYLTFIISAGGHGPPPGDTHE